MKRTVNHLNLRALALGVSVAALLLLASVAFASVPLPRATTGKVSNVRGTSAQLNGTINPRGLAGVTYFFKYGPPTAPLSLQTTPVAVSGNAPVKVGQMVSGFAQSYHYEIFATWPAGTADNQSYGAGTTHGKEALYTATSKSSPLKFELEHGKEAELSVSYGGTLEFAGHLAGTGSANHTVTLQQTPFPYTSAFTTLGASTLTSSSGSFTFKIPDMTHNLQVRVVATGPRPVYSRTVALSVTPKVVLHMHQGGKTDLFRLYGTSDPTKPGTEVIIQRLLPRPAKSKGSGPVTRTVATTVLKRYTHKLSRFSVILALSGTYRYRAFVSLPKGTLSSGHSNDVLIHSPSSGATGKRG